MRKIFILKNLSQFWPGPQRDRARDCNNLQNGRVKQGVICYLNSYLQIPLVKMTTKRKSVQGAKFFALIDLLGRNRTTQSFREGSFEVQYFLCLCAIMFYNFANYKKNQHIHTCSSCQRTGQYVKIQISSKRIKKPVRGSQKKQSSNSYLGTRECSKIKVTAFTFDQRPNGKFYFYLFTCLSICLLALFSNACLFVDLFVDGLCESWTCILDMFVIITDYLCLSLCSVTSSYRKTCRGDGIIISGFEVGNNGEEFLFADERQVFYTCHVMLLHIYSFVLCLYVFRCCYKKY